MEAPPTLYLTRLILCTLRTVKFLLIVAVVSIGLIALFTNVRPLDAEQFGVPSYDLDVRQGCISVDNSGRMEYKPDCYRASCNGPGTDCTWKWRGACFRYGGG
ncbi:MAG: hypothetical protein OXE92_04195 [Bacteroidetes bacterium]|nr:hypothetical protein [Bacteroidota bacterium]MCY4204910.1 hypothetical protein [Bacteroidota bacterium]